MGVPEEIRKVPRPVNTVVVDTGGKGNKRYAVRERIGEKYIPGGNPQPRSGRVIGYIYEGEYHEKIFAPKRNFPDVLSYGAAAFVHNVSSDIFDDLASVFDLSDAVSIIVCASLKVIYPSVPADRLAAWYGKSFFRMFYPGAALSEGRMKRLYEKIGRDLELRTNFYQKRMERVQETHHVLIDGTLKQDTLTVNDLSRISGKSKTREGRKISLIYAYDLELMEPVCCTVYPGDAPDISAYRSFLIHNRIQKGILLGGKDFSPSKIADLLTERPELHFLAPLKKNDSRISNNHMLEFQGELKGLDRTVLFCKRQIRGGRYLYSFQDVEKEASAKRTYFEKHKNSQANTASNTELEFDYGKYLKDKDSFGVLALESDLDMSPLTAYRSYLDGWKMELVFRQYGNDFDLTRAHEGMSFQVYGLEFINSIAALIACRLVSQAAKAGIFEDFTFQDLMIALAGVWRQADAPLPGTQDDGYWAYPLTRDEFLLMEKLGVVPPLPGKEPKKRGRKPKNQT